MSKKLIFLKIIIFFICILSGCSTTPKEPPNISIKINGNEITYFISKNSWDGSKFDRASAYQHVFKENPNLDNLFETKTGDEVVLDFGHNKPQKISIFYEFLTPNEENIASKLEKIDVNYNVKNEKYSFFIDKNETEILSSQAIECRLYMITASLGENECEYAFVIRNSIGN